MPLAEPVHGRLLALREKLSEPFDLFRGGALDPARLQTEAIDVDLYTTLLDLVTPRPLHQSIDEEHRRDPALRPIHATAQVARKQVTGMPRCSDDVVIERRQQTHRATSWHFA